MEHNDLTASLKVEEYKALRQQIDSQSRLQVQVFTFSIISSSALLGYFLKLLSDTGHSLLTLQLLFAPSFILVPCAYLIKDMRDEIYRWGTYIYVFLENESGSSYEGALGSMRERFGSSESFNPMFLTFWCFTFVCIGLYTLLAANASLLALWQAVPWLCVVWLLLRADIEFRNIPNKKRKLYIETWRSINTSSRFKA